MAVPEFVRHQTDDFDNNRSQDAVLDWINELKRSIPILDGVLIEAVVSVGSDTLSIEHGLGRKWRGWIITRRNGNAQQFTDDDTPSKDFLILTSASGTATNFDIWIY